MTTTTSPKLIPNVLILLICTLLFSSLNAQNCLLADYQLNGNAVDASGNGFDGQVLGALSTSDQFGNSDQAYLFDGIDDRIVLNNNIPIITGTEFTIMACFRMDGEGGGNQATNNIFQQRSDPTGGNFSKIVLNGSNNQGNLAFAVSPSGTNTFNRVDIPHPSFGDWHHVAAVLANDSLRVYVDGQIAGASPYNLTGDYVSGIDYVEIGRHEFLGGAPNGLFNGAIETVQLYDCALDANEIASCADLILTGINNLELSETLRPNDMLSDPEAYRNVVNWKVYDVNGASITGSEFGKSFERNTLSAGVYIMQIEPIGSGISEGSKFVVQ